jgi:hypothetical protein
LEDIFVRREEILKWVGLGKDLTEVSDDMRPIDS